MSQTFSYAGKKLNYFLDAIRNIRSGKYPIFLDYEVETVPRYGHGKPPHAHLYEIINKNREVYKNHLNSFLHYTEQLVQIPITYESDNQPFYINGYLPGLDSIAIYCFLAMYNPKRYIEVGSGNSTKFAYRAIDDNKLRTKIISVDPFPRTKIDKICDQIIRIPLEKMDLDIFDTLEDGDILFIDNSHRCFTNSDVTVVFLDIIPKLQKGVIVEFHDIFLPYDYSSVFANNWYSEQYLLACYLLSEGSKFDIILPNMFISEDQELSEIMKPLWERSEMRDVASHGGSFWIKIR
ncbi:MAG: class I SAM-dependent methyltransferase [Nitrospirae bacterium]|nr:class I SAM-dependent methyltransferase [Nitrospirota bacterium]